MDKELKDLKRKLTEIWREIKRKLTEIWREIKNHIKGVFESLYANRESKKVSYIWHTPRKIVKKSQVMDRKPTNIYARANL